MSTGHVGLNPFERLLSLVTRIRPGEGRAAFLFFMHGFLLLSSYQVVKALREAFMLTKFSAETRSYAVALMALVVAVAAYAQSRRTARQLAQMTEMYWQLKFDHGELKAKVDPAAPVAPKPQETFIPLTQLKR